MHKTIHISRAPFPAITSYTKKMLSENSSASPNGVLSTAVLEWVSAWNHGVCHEQEENFLHVLYEELCQRPAEWAAKIREFLELDTPPDFSGMRNANKDDATCISELLELVGGSQVELLLPFKMCANWEDFAASRKPLGLPLRGDQPINLTSSSNDYLRYVAGGFYPREPHGSWIKGRGGRLVFTPAFTSDACMLALTTTWIFAPNDEPATIEVLVNGKRCGGASFKMPEQNGVPATCFIALQGSAESGGLCSEGVPVVLEFRVCNPRSPKDFGFEDDRQLSVMIKELSLSPF